MVQGVAWGSKDGDEGIGRGFPQPLVCRALCWVLELQASTLVKDTDSGARLVNQILLLPLGQVASLCVSVSPSVKWEQ